MYIIVCFVNGEGGKYEKICHKNLLTDTARLHESQQRELHKNLETKLFLRDMIIDKR